MPQMLKASVQIPRKRYSKAEHLRKTGAQLLYIFRTEKALLFFERKKMCFQPSVLQFGEEFHQIKSQTEQEKFCGDIGFAPHQETSELAVALENAKSSLYLNGTVHPKQSASLCGKALKVDCKLVDTGGRVDRFNRRFGRK